MLVDDEARRSGGSELADIARYLPHVDVGLVEMRKDQPEIRSRPVRKCHAVAFKALRLHNAAAAEPGSSRSGEPERLPSSAQDGSDRSDCKAARDPKATAASVSLSRFAPPSVGRRASAARPSLRGGPNVKHVLHQRCGQIEGSRQRHRRGLQACLMMSRDDRRA